MEELGTRTRKGGENKKKLDGIPQAHCCTTSFAFFSPAFKDLYQVRCALSSISPSRKRTSSFFQR